MDKKHRGCLSEHRAICWLLSQGFEVCRNVSQHGPVDLVAITGEGGAILVDVKSIPTSRWKLADGTITTKPHDPSTLLKAKTKLQEEIGVRLLGVHESGECVWIN